MDWKNDALYDLVPVSICYSRRLAKATVNVPDLPRRVYPYRLFHVTSAYRQGWLSHPAFAQTYGTPAGELDMSRSGPSQVRQRAHNSHSTSSCYASTVRFTLCALSAGVHAQAVAQQARTGAATRPISSSAAAARGSNAPRIMSLAIDSLLAVNDAQDVQQSSEQFLTIAQAQAHEPLTRLNSTGRRSSWTWRIRAMAQVPSCCSHPSPPRFDVTLRRLAIVQRPDGATTCRPHS